MSKIQQVLLDDVVEIIGGGTPSRDNPEYYNGPIPWFTVKDFGENLFLTRSQESITEKGLRKSASNLIPKGNVILVTRMAVGKVAINKIDIAINQDLKALKCKPSLDPKYLLFFLLSQKETLESQADGATVKGITLDSVKELKIPLPPLEEQKRIVQIAGKCDRLRRTRRYTQQLSNTYLQSIFLEMFGDALNLEYGGQYLGDLVTITGGGTPSRDIPEYFIGSIPWLTSKDMKGEYVFDTQEHITQKAIQNSATKLVPKESILMVVKSKVLMHRLPLAIAKVELCHGQDIKSIQCSNKINPYFLLFILKHNEKNLLVQARGANTEGLTLPMIEEISIPQVPIDFQEKFAQIVQRFERLRAQQRESDRQAEHLFQSILHRAFQGEL
jgi:type I restriction enzyme, S subunit